MGGRVRSYELVARSDGWTYSSKLRVEGTWRHIKAEKVPEYSPSKYYQPHHLKNLKRGCKLFLENHFPGYASHPWENKKTSKK